MKCKNCGKDIGDIEYKHCSRCAGILLGVEDYEM